MKICDKKLRDICLNRIKSCNINLKLNTKINSIDDLSSYKFKVIATYSSINDFETENKDYQFGLCEKPIFLLPKRYQNKSIVIMDGPFMCFDPYGLTKYHVGGNVVHAIHNSNVGKTPKIPAEFFEYICGIIKNPKITKVSNLLIQLRFFFPEIDQAKHIGSMYTIRTVLPYKEKTDARPTIGISKEILLFYSAEKLGIVLQQLRKLSIIFNYIF